MHDSGQEQDGGGGRHKDKKSKAEKKQATRQEPVSNKGPAILVSEKDAVIQMLEGTEGHREIIKSISEARDEGHGMQGKKVHFGGEEQSEETRAESTDEPELTGRFAEARTGRGSAGLVRSTRPAEKGKE